MLDQLGIPLQVGDKVIYTTGAQSNSSLEIGEIAEIQTRLTGWDKTPTEVAMIKTASGRSASNWRTKYELISVQYHNAMKKHLEETQPELFV